MANDFSGDANCKALYTFENDFPTEDQLDDEKGTNHLAKQGSPTRVADPKEGTFSGELETDNSDYFNLADAGLDSGFPTKTTESNKDISICFWVKFENLTVTQRMVSKYDSGDDKRSWQIVFVEAGDLIRFVLGYNGGVSAVTASHATDGDLTASRWYHIGIIYDDDGGGDGKGNVKIRIWDDNGSVLVQSSSADTHDEDMGQQIALQDSQFAIGTSTSSGTPGGFLDARLDEVVIFNDLLSIAEIDEIRNGTFGAGAALFASISDSLGISDTVVTKTGYIRSAVDSVGISDVLTRIATYIRNLAVNLATTDTINTARSLKRSMSDNVGITDTVTAKKFVLVALSDNLGITDVVTRIITFIRLIPDTFGITDVITRIITFIRSIPDTLAISDTITTIRIIVRSIADAVGITDVLTSEKFILATIADNIGITDAIATIGTFIRGIADGVGITDVISRIGTFIRSQSDNVGVTDMLTPTKGVFRTIADGVGITDVLATVVGKVASIADNIGITDVLTFIRTTVVGGRIFIAGVAKSLRISGTNKSLTVSGEDKSLKISGSGD